MFYLKKMFKNNCFSQNLYSRRINLRGSLHTLKAQMAVEIVHGHEVNMESMIQAKEIKLFIINK